MTEEQYSKPCKCHRVEVIFMFYSVCVSVFLKFVFIVSMFFICCFVCFYFKKSVLISYPQLTNQENDQHLFSHLL